MGFLLLLGNQILAGRRCACSIAKPNPKLVSGRCSLILILVAI